MNSFNLLKYVESMGSMHLKNREPMRWWSLEELLAGGDDKWALAASKNPWLNDVLEYAKSKHQDDIRKTNTIYGVDFDKAEDLVKTYVAYHEKYGAYVGFLAPYYSIGYKWGMNHRRIWAEDSFHFYYIRKAMLTNENFQDAVQSRIQKHIKSMGITFEPSDLALEIKKPVGYNPNRKRQSYQVDKYIPTLDIKDPRIQEFLQSNKLIPDNSKYTINAKGHLKILKSLMGKWYYPTVEQKANNENKTIEQAEQDLINDEEMTKKIYKIVRNKWEAAREMGDPAAEISTIPPTYSDKSLDSTSGQQQPGEVIEDFMDKSMIGAFNKGKDRIKIYMVTPPAKDYTSDDLTAFKEAKQRLEHPEEQIPESFTQEDIGEISSNMPEAEKEMPEEMEPTKPSIVEQKPVESVIPVTQNITEEIPDSKQKNVKTPKNIPVKKPTIKTPSKNTSKKPAKKKEEIPDIISNTINNLIKIAAELDENDKVAQAEEVHKVIRKYIERL